MTRERAGTVAVNALPDSAIPACAAVLLEALVRYGVAVPVAIPVFASE